MKKIYGFAFASAIMALASCSNENEPNIGGGSNVVDDGTRSYLALNISDLSGTRADDDEYQIGESNENNVASAKFVVLSKYDAVNKTWRDTNDDDADYQVTYVETPADMTWNGAANFPNTVEMIGSPVLVIPGSATGAWDNDNAGNIPNDIEIVVLLNCGNINIANGMTKKALKETIVELAKSGETGSFQMSNSTYADASGAKVYGQKVSYSYLMKSEDYAKNNPVDVYVERLAARADVSIAHKDGKPVVENNQIYWQNNSGKEIDVTVDIKGLYFFHDPANENLLKSVEGNWTSAWGAANDAANFRSYWATMPDEDKLGVDKISFSSVISTDATNLNKWDGSNGADKIRYIAENTLGQDDLKKATKMVVAAQLMQPSSTDASTLVPLEMCEVMGQFTDLDGAKALVAAQLNGLGYRVYTGSTTVGEGAEAVTTKHYRTITASDLVFTNKATANEYDSDGKVTTQYDVEEGDGNRTYFELATLTGDEEFAKFTGSYENNYPVLATADLDEMNKKLKEEFQFSYWKEGYTYYYVDINHLTFGQQATVGIVRNHLYDINVSKISGLGTPVFNPDEILIPTQPEYKEKDKVFLAARVNILKWRIVSNDNIVLGPKN